MSLEDESQQPLVGAPGLGGLRGLANQYPSVILSQSEDIESSSQSVPAIGNISIETDASESIRWGSPAAKAETHIGNGGGTTAPSIPALLSSVSEQPEREASEDDGRISSPSPSAANASGDIASEHASKSSTQVSDRADDQDEPEDISSPGASDDGVVSTPKRRRLPRQSQSDTGPRGTPERADFQPITSSLPVVGSQPSPAARLTTPLKHASHVSPSKTKPVSTQNTPTKSAPAQLLPPSSPISRLGHRAPSPESSDFTRDMMYKERPQRVLERMLSAKDVSGSMTSSNSSQETTFRNGRRQSIPVDNPPPPSECAPPSSGLVEDILEDPPPSAVGEPTFVDQSMAEMTPTGRSSSSQHRGSETQAEEEPIPGGTSQTLSESGSIPLFSRSTPQGNRFGNLPSSNAGSQTRRSPSALFSDAYDDVGGKTDSQLLRFNDSFIATQVIPPPHESPVHPPPRQSASSRASTTSSKPLPPHRLLQRRDRGSTSEHSMPAVARARSKSPPPPLYEATFVENTFVDPPTQPSEDKPDVEMLEAQEKTSSAPVNPSSSHQPSQPLQPLTSEPERPFDPSTPPPAPESSDRPEDPPSIVSPPSFNPVTDVYNVPEGSIFRAPKPKPSPRKYGGRGRRVSVEPYESDSSSSAPEDPDDETFKNVETQAVSPPLSPPPPLPPAKTPAAARKPPSSKPAPRSRQPSSITSSRLPGRGKRKQLSPGAELSDSSSSAPEDQEDYSYRPTIKAQAKAQAAAKVKSRSGSPPRKKTKAAPRSSRTSTSSHLSTPPKTASRPVSRAASRAVSTGRGASVATDVDPAESAIRVLALWNKTKEYFAGTIVGQSSRGYRIKFDDNCSGTVAPDKVRLLHLRPGDPVYDGTDPAEYRVAEEFNCTGTVVDVLNVKGKPYKIAVIRLVVQPRDITSAFDDRKVPQAFVDAQFPIAASRQSTASAAFAGKAFLLTGTDPKMDLDSLKQRIERHGGEIIPTWDAPFRITSTDYTITTPAVPFTLQIGDKCIMTPKIMASLGAGIPLLSAHYIDAAIDHNADWRGYLISPGESKLLRQPASQLIDPQWGEATWDRSAAKALRRPLEGKTVLFVEPSSRFPRRDELKPLVPFCLVTLGATVSRATSLPAVITTDIAVVEDRDKGLKISPAARKSGKLANVAWLKACLLGAVIPPELGVEK